MSAEVSRKQFGMTDKGQVVVIGKSSYDERGGNQVTTFEVRHGVRTVVEGVSEEQASVVANALVGKLPEPPAPPPAATAAGVQGRVSRGY